MDKEKLFDYAVRLVEANLKGKALAPIEFQKATEVLLPKAYEGLASYWKEISEEEKA